MNCTATNLSFEETGFFSKIIIDYLNKADELKPFYKHPVSIDGIKSAIHARQQFNTNRKVLVEQLQLQYKTVASSKVVLHNINKLSEENTFTITTAHQPAIFTGTLYFIYKILHTIKLSEELKKEFPQFDFVPVYFMGSEDADLDELGNIYLNNEKIVWDTNQKGAVGRMKPNGLEKIIDRIEGEFGIEPYGKELVQLLRDSYLKSPDIQTGTFQLVHKLFADRGLIVFIPDNAAYKNEMVHVFEDDLLHQTASGIVEQTIGRLS
ncbi:MAG: bacillithiol biosynthesis BshC, partial [Bacteroidetes bacterium]|nr:bacillithiol biosynthesis BshC [Bacteroidota bacterium]